MNKVTKVLTTYQPKLFYTSKLMENIVISIRGTFYGKNKKRVV